MSKRFCRYIGMGMALSFAFTASVHAASVWSNTLGNNVMTNAGNWSSDPLTSTSYLDISLSGTDRAVMSAGMSLTANDIRIGIAGATTTGELEITGGYLRSNRSGGDTRIGYSGRTGIVNQSGGEWEVAQALVVGIGGTGIYNLSGGELDNQRDEFVIDGANSIMTISGGILKTRFDATIKNSGTFKVEGTGATSIGIGGSASGNGTWTQSSGGIFSVRIDTSPTGVTKTSVVGSSGDVTFESGALLDVGFTGAFTNGGIFTVMEWDGSVTNNGLTFATGVDTNIWSFNVDAAGKKMTVTAQGDPTPPPVDVTLAVGAARNQMMRYGLDYERLWYWDDEAVAQEAEIADWSVNDCNIDYIRTAMNSGYELAETNFNLSAYTDRIIPMMTAMQDANPNIKWFASPRPLDEAYPNKQWNGTNVTWQPYPIWVTGATTPISGDYDFNDIKCSEYIIRYLLLMKSYGFKITYLDITNEWQSDNYGGRITQFDVRDIVAEFQNYLASPWEHPEIPGLVLTADDIPLIVGPSSWNYQQGAGWIDSLNTQAKKDAIDIASSHNTDRTGTASNFVATVATYCNPGTEAWETEQHGWKSTSGENEVTSFYYYIQTVRAGFTGINGWLAIGTPDQGHSYLLNDDTSVTRNVKYHIFKKLTTTSNYGYALDIDELSTDSTMAFVRDNLLTVWVNNTSTDPEVVEIDISSHVRSGADITYTRWNESLSVEGVAGMPISSTSTSLVMSVEGESLYCIEIPLVDNEDNFPFVQAENYDAGSGVSIQGDGVAFAAAGSEIEFDLDVTKTYGFDVGFRVSSASANIAFELYDGTNLLASVDQAATGGAQNWITVNTTLDLDGGPMNLRIVATGGGWNMDWIEFEEVILPDPPTGPRNLYWTGGAGTTDPTDADNWATNATGDAATWGVYENDTLRVGEYHVVPDNAVTSIVDYVGGTTANQNSLLIGDRRSGVFNMNSGDFNFSGGATIGFGSYTGNGILNMNGGALHLKYFRSGMHSGTAAININGGTYTSTSAYRYNGVDTGAILGWGSGGYSELNITGGSCNSRFGAYVGVEGGIGKVHVEGSAATSFGFGTISSANGYWVQGSNSTLSVAVDGGGITPIVINGDRGVSFASNSVIEVAWSAGVTNYGVFDVMTWDGTFEDNGLVLGAGVDTNIWNFSFVDTDSDNTNDTLRVTAVPGTTSNGTSILWLQSYGLDESDDDIDNDEDGLLTWEEYIAGTNPTNAASVLKVISLVSEGADYVITWQSVAGKSYSIITNASLIVPNPGTATSGIPGAVGDETSVTSSIPSAPTVFIEVGVE